MEAVSTHPASGGDVIATQPAPADSFTTLPSPPAASTALTSRKRRPADTTRTSSSKGSMIVELETAGLIKRGRGVDPKDNVEKMEIRCTADGNCTEKWYFNKVVSPLRPTDHIKFFHPNAQLPAKHYVSSYIMVREGAEGQQAIRDYQERNKEALKYKRNSPSASSKKPAAAKKQKRNPNLFYCDLCDNTSATHEMVQSECCGGIYCDESLNDGKPYEIFSYQPRSCYEQHVRYTLCHGHFAEGHAGDWQQCKACRLDQTVNNYIGFATSHLNTKPMSPSQMPATKRVTCTGRCKQTSEKWVDDPACQTEQYVCSACTGAGPRVVELGGGMRLVMATGV